MFEGKEGKMIQIQTNTISVQVVAVVEAVKGDLYCIDLLNTSIL